jgi:hypothetical protein
MSERFKNRMLIRVKGRQAVPLEDNARSKPITSSAASRPAGPLETFTSTTAPKYPTEVIVC